MNDRELINRFLESGYVITDPGKFYREIRTTSLDNLLNELNSFESSDSQSVDYSSVEDDVLSYIREVRGLVVNDSGYNSSDSQALNDFINLLRELDNKYLLTARANERSFEINTEINRARDELNEINSRLSSALAERVSINRNRGELRRELNELNNNTTISNVERTERTFAIMDELQRLSDELSSKNYEIGDIRNESNAKVEEIRGLQASLNEAREPEKPEYNADMRDALIADVNRVNDFAINELNISQDTKNNVRRLSLNFGARQQLPFVTSESASRSLNELMDRFGIAKTEEYVKPEEEIESNEPVQNEIPEEEKVEEPKEVVGPEVPVEEETVKEEVPSEEVKEITPTEDTFDLERILAVFNTPKEEEKVEEPVVEAPAEEVKEELPKEEPKVEEQPAEEKPVKKVVYTGKMGNITINQSTFADLVVGKEYEVEYEDEINYKLKGLDAFYIKNVFVDPNLWAAINVFNDLKPREEKAEVIASEPPIQKEEEIVKEEPPKEEEKIEPPVEEEKEELVFYIANPNPLDTFVLLTENLKNGDVVEVEEVLDNGLIKLVGHNTPINSDYFISKEKWEEINKKIEKPAPEEPKVKETLKEEKPKGRKVNPMYEEGKEIVYLLYANLTDEEKEYFDLNYTKRGLELGKKYKITNVNDNSVNLEGFDDINFPMMGFVTPEDYEELVNRGVIKPEDLAKGKEETPKEEEPDGELVVYYGPDTDELENGKVYKRIYVINNKKALLEDNEGNKIVLNNYDASNFGDYEPPRKNKLPEVVMVEKIKKLNNIGGGMTALGIMGVIGTLVANPLLGGAALAILLTSGAISVAGVIPQTKFAHSFVASKIYNDVKNKLANINYDISTIKDISVDDLMDYKTAKDELESSLKKIEAEADKRGISARFL